MPKMSVFQPANAAEIENAWREWVTFYTLRRLTFAKDKLPAIAGLARRFSVKSNSFLFLAIL